MYIYGEEFILINLTANFCIAYSVLVNMQTDKKILRAFFSAISGVMISIALLYTENINAGIPLKIAASFLMSLPLLFPHITLKSLFLSALLMIASSGVCSGCIMLISSNLREPLSVYAFNEVSVFSGLLAGCILNISLFAFLRKTMFYKTGIRLCCIKCKERSMANIRLLADTGNLASDDAGNSIIFLSTECFKSLTGINRVSVPGYEEYKRFYERLPDDEEIRVNIKKIATLTSTDYKILYKADLLVFENGKHVHCPVLTYSEHLNGQKYNGIFNPYKIEERG